MIYMLHLSVFQDKSEKGAPEVIVPKTTLCQQITMHHWVFVHYSEKKTVKK